MSLWMGVFSLTFWGIMNADKKVLRVGSPLVHVGGIFPLSTSREDLDCNLISVCTRHEVR